MTRINNWIEEDTVTMGSVDSQTLIWLVSSLFWVGVLLIPLGLLLLIVPGRAMKLADYLNRWVSTQVFFDAINRPLYQEKFFYKHHHIFGAAIVILATFSLYMLVFYAGMEVSITYFLSLAESEFENWLFVNVYYLLLGMLCIALCVGMVIIIRPSALKKLETWANRWIATDEKLGSLDEMHHIPGNILSNNPRLFGLFVLSGAAYIMYMTVEVVF